MHSVARNKPPSGSALKSRPASWSTCTPFSEHKNLHNVAAAALGRDATAVLRHIFYQSLKPIAMTAALPQYECPVPSTLQESGGTESFRHQASSFICKAPTPYLCKVNFLKLKIYKVPGVLKTKSNLTCNFELICEDKSVNNEHSKWGMSAVFVLVPLQLSQPNSTNCTSHRQVQLNALLCLRDKFNTHTL